MRGRESADIEHRRVDGPHLERGAERSDALEAAAMTTGNWRRGGR
jgi:hypothetical protein